VTTERANVHDNRTKVLLETPKRAQLSNRFADEATALPQLIRLDLIGIP
jgi:hypothetical protein